MGTPWAEIITDYAMVRINDIRLTEEMQDHPALFFRKMALYMKNAIPRFSQPPEERDWLVGTEPVYVSVEYQANGILGETVETDQTGFELFSADLIREDKFGNPVAVPLPECKYDSDTGIVTLQDGIEPSSRISMDFYSDGCFDRELSYEEKDILGMCVQLIWEGRFIGEWLNRVPKVQDKTFSMGSEANRTRADTERMRLLESDLNSAMRRYAQNIAYRNVVPEWKRFRNK